VKEPDRPVSAIPHKRTYFAIVADYDLPKALCELIDNVLDVCTSAGTRARVSITLDSEQQTIRVEDWAGGIGREDLELIVAPGRTNASGRDSTIGFFGVGSKRAVVALAQDIQIRTRTVSGDQTFLVELDDAWIEDQDNWELPSYKVDAIPPGTTRIDLSRLRSPVTRESADSITEYCGRTYAWFLRKNLLDLKVNNRGVQPIEFSDWAYPPGFSPRDYHTVLASVSGESIEVRLRAGLMRQASMSGGWGFYVFCNNRFIVGPVQDATVGFVVGQLGRAHPELALFRAELWLTGPSASMPWNSSKSDVNRGHRVFLALRDWWVQTLSDWTSLSRRLVGEWNERVTPFTEGTIERVESAPLPAVGRSYLPDLPAGRPRIARQLRAANASVIEEKPWVAGLIESVEIVDLVRKRSLETAGRVALILLDSTLEIAFKEFLVNSVATETYGDDRLGRLFAGPRAQLESEMKRHVSLPADVWRKIRYYYRIRCDLTHRRATVDISQRNIDDYRATVVLVLEKLFGTTIRS
jgi:hypothetical protein